MPSLWPPPVRMEHVYILAIPMQSPANKESTAPKSQGRKFYSYWRTILLRDISRNALRLGLTKVYTLHATITYQLILLITTGGENALNTHLGQVLRWYILYTRGSSYLIATRSRENAQNSYQPDFLWTQASRQRLNQNRQVQTKTILNENLSLFVNISFGCYKFFLYSFMFVLAPNENYTSVYYLTTSSEHTIDCLYITTNVNHAEM